jgi:hypothetical protein
MVVGTVTVPVKFPLGSLVNVATGTPFSSACSGVFGGKPVPVSVAG